MSNNFKFPYINKDKKELVYELNKKSIYYGNVVIWTVFFTLPLFWLLDFLIDRTDWMELTLIRLIVATLSYIIYIIGNKKQDNFLSTITWFVSINVLMYSIICGFIPINQLMAYFLMISVVMLLFNTILFWPPVYSVLICLLSYLVLIVLFYYKDRMDKFAILISHGGGVYFIVSSFSCLISYNRYQIIKRGIEKNSIIDAANNRLLEQNEKINDQKYVIEETNRRLEVMNDHRKNAMKIMQHDFENFADSIQMSLDLLKKSSANLSKEQTEILDHIDEENRKLNYLSLKLAESADGDDTKIDYNNENLDINRLIEVAVIEMADTALIKQISIQLHLSASTIVVFLDKLFLGQVLFKILINATRYAEEGSVIAIHTHQLQEKCVIEVINIGKLIGIEKLNELFNKLDPGKSIQESIQNDDIGFSVAKKLVENMGGQVTYNSTVNTGNYYRIEFNYTH